MEQLKSESLRNLRRPKGYISVANVNLLHLKNPWVTAWWSAAFPGYGYIIMGSYVKGFLLAMWEFAINYEARLNTAIYYSLLGRFEMAKDVIDINWFLLYIAVYIYAIWSSYHLTVDLNKLSILADREDSMIIPVKIGTMEICFLDKRVPWVAAVLSLFAPGLGHLYTHRIPTSFFLMINYIIVAYYSHVLPAIHYTAIGAFGQAAAVLDPQWFMILPSLIGFAVYDAYVNTVEYNRLFEMEQARFLSDNYQKTYINRVLAECLGGTNDYRGNF